MSHILDRRARLVLPPNQNFINSQLSLDSLLTNFTQGASDWRSLASMTLGGLAYRFTKLGLMACPLGRNLPFASRIFTPLFSLSAEVSVYRQGMNFLHADSPAHFQQSWSTDFVNFGALKVFGAASRNTNLILSHALQDLGMVTGHQLAYGLDLADRPQGSLAEQFVHAEVTNLQLAAGMQLLHIGTAGRIQVLESSLDLQANVHVNASRHSHLSQAIERLNTLTALQRMSFVRSEDITSLRIRDYQEEGVQALGALPSLHRDRGLVVLPTGTGKTVLFSEFAGRFAKNFPESNILVITHREEIIGQNVTWLERVFGKANVGVFQGARQELDKHVTVASIQSLLPSKADLSRFDLVILDEVHHYVHGNEWFRPLQEMGFFNENGDITYNEGKFLIGLTATPDRLSGKALNTTFGMDGLLYGKDITSFTGRRDPQTGELYLLKPYGIQLNLLMKDVANPWQAIRLAEATEKAQAIANIFEQRLREGDRYKRSIVFVSDKDEVVETSRQLRQKGLKVFELTDDVPDGIRKDGVAAYKRGEYDALVSIRIPTEGFDDPGTEAVVLGLATDSRALLVQMVGRCLRPDPLHPERTEGIIVDMGGNLRRHRIGASIQELYEATRSDESGIEIKRGSVEAEESAPPVHDVEIHELGNLFAHNAFSQTLREFLTPDAVPALAYKTNKSSDIFFNYLNAMELPTSVHEVRELATLLNDSQNRLVDAWAWDKVAEMENGQALRANLTAHERRLAERFRWAIWRNFNGAITVAVASQNSPLRDFWRDGELPLHNPPKLLLVGFYKQMADLMCQEQAMSISVVAAMQIEAIRAQRVWNALPADVSSAADVLLTWTREHLIDRYKGEVPMSGEDFLLQSSLLRPYFEKGEIPFEGNLEGFWEQLISFLGRGEASRELRVRLLAREVMRNKNEWDQDFPQATDPEVSLHSWFIESLLTRRYGLIRQFAGFGYDLVAKLRKFANMRQLPDPESRENMAVFYDPLLELAAGNDSSSLAEGKGLIHSVLRRQLRWDGTVPGLKPQVQNILDAFREKALEKYYGQWPTKGDQNIPSRHPLRRFLEKGEELNIAEHREELRRFIEPSDPVQFEKDLHAAIWEQQSWNPPLSGQALAIQNLHAWVREWLTPQFRGNAKVYGAPLRRFLETGELPEKLYGRFSMEDFYLDMLAKTAGQVAERLAAGRVLIHQAVKAQRGWDQALPDVSPEVNRVLDRFFNIVVEDYWGLVPEADSLIQRGGRLRKIVDNRQWPNYKGTAARHNWMEFSRELKTFFENKGLSREEAASLVDAAIPQ